MISQNTKILAHLRAGNSITAMDALSKFGSFRLAARIADLRKAGYQIGDIWETDGDKRFKRYFLVAQ